MDIGHITKMTEKFMIDNSPAILTGIGVAGVITTAVLTGKAAIEAHKILEEQKNEVWKQALQGQTSILRSDIELTAKAKVNLVWREFIPPVLAGATTIFAIVASNQIGTKRSAALAAAYSLSERHAAEFKAKIAEKVGDKKVQEVQDEIAQERIDSNPNAEVVIIGDGKVKCLEQFTGRYFMIRSVEDIKAAQNAINYKLNNDMYASLSDFYDLLDIPHTTYSDEVGWKNSKLLEITIGGALDEDKRPVVAFDYVVEPVRNYFRLG